MKSGGQLIQRENLQLKEQTELSNPRGNSRTALQIMLIGNQIMSCHYDVFFLSFQNSKLSNIGGGYSLGTAVKHGLITAEQIWFWKKYI